MTNTASRSDRRPDWLKRKHAGPASSTPDSEWADQAIPQLVAIVGAGPRRIPLPEGTSPDRAQQLRGALYDAAYKGYNRRVAEADKLSMSLHVADIASGKCARCDRMGCTPSPGRATLHVLVNTKRDGRAHQASIPREEWDYDPLAPKPRQRAEDSGQEPRRMFGADRAGPVEPDPPPSKQRGAPPPPPEAKPGKDAKSAPAADEGLAAKLRRWTS